MPPFILIVPLGVLALVLFRFFFPGMQGVLPQCPFYAATGLHCPGCGGTRSAEALVHFNLGLAMRQHAWFVGVVLVGLPFLSWMALKEKYVSIPGPLYHDRWLWFCFWSLLVFAILRNLPGMEWMAPY